jgi:adenylate kinase
MYFKPPKSDETCDRDQGVRLVIRADDSIDKVRVRLKTYQEQTQPLLNYYSESKRLHRVDGTRDTESIYHDIEKIIREH